MSYEVTATRRRPQKFDDLVGQEFVAETLKNSIKSGKIAHAYLFSGPRGCGKTSTARILAKALNCQNGPTDSPCGVCPNCQEITKGSSLDVIEIDGASNNGVENARQIKDEVLFPPSNSKYKIYIIDEVHMLSSSAFNALLKTIEEPPSYAVFIFATTELQKVPVTIKSRCQQYNFRLVAVEKVKQCLADAAAELNIQADDEALYWIARESTGSMRDAYTIFDQVVAFSDGHITYEKIRDKLGLVGLDRLNTIFEACAQNQTEKVINLIDEFLQAGVSIEQLISNSADYLRSLLLIKSGVTKESLLGNSVERYSSVVLNSWNPIQIERALSIYLQLFRDIRYSLSPRYELELAFSRLCWINQYVSNMEVKKAIDAAQALLNGTPVAPQIATSEPSKTAIQTQTPVFNMSAAVPVQNQQVPVAAVPEVPVQTESAGSVNNLPPGMPHFSMLDKFFEKENSQQSGEGESSNPFLNGGSLPPEQRVVVDTSDFQDDNWTNTDEPPEEDYYQETEEFTGVQAEELYEATQAPVEENFSAPVQLDEKFLTADGKTLSIAQLRGAVMADLAVNNSFLAAAVEKTGEWKVLDNKVETYVESEYEQSLLKRNAPDIAKVISCVIGKQVSFEILVQKKDSADTVKKKLPEQIKIVLDVFKGSIVGR